MFAEPTAHQPTAEQPGGDAPGQPDKGDQGQRGCGRSDAVDNHRIGASMAFWRGCPGRGADGCLFNRIKAKRPGSHDDPIDLPEDDIQEALAPSGLHIEEDDDSGSELDNNDDVEDDDDDTYASNAAPLEEELEQEASTEYAQGTPLAANGQSPTSNMNNDGSTFSQHAPTAANRQVDAGMTVTLMPHQVLEVNWKLQREGANKPGGGILADDMGLGKTIQVNATVLGDRKDYDPTLMVVPLSLLGQWELEIGLQTADGGLTSFAVYGEAHKTSSNLTSYDIVFTSELKARGPDAGDTDGTLQFSEYSKGKSQTSIENNGTLGRRQWRRVVLEDAAKIRNHETQVAKPLPFEGDEMIANLGNDLTNESSFEFTGKMSHQQRDATIVKFSDAMHEVRVIDISTIAGGVEVYRLAPRQSVEERMFDLRTKASSADCTYTQGDSSTVVKATQKKLKLLLFGGQGKRTR
ncbi:hypothetical protein QFC21_001909 [Naganishia friedmannii]|uniref:Uncharacterized protein n=1 Tax=Naganishia friedmannii TaxID=89922 RepID=A0ACC2VZJ4_9TREE|nr:hypothetical protein QFC21_001909 [Naganishia friedmannii]